ncbi:hypothetical protein A245_46468, partial [Pseudomonas syringae pv. actinidiae ICMP 19096]
METLFETLRSGGLGTGHRKLQGIHVFFEYREQQRRKIIQLAALFFRKLMGRKRPEDRYFATKVFRSLRRVKMNRIIEQQRAARGRHRLVEHRRRRG